MTEPWCRVDVVIAVGILAAIRLGGVRGVVML
jgi:hypothetical protein